MTHNEQTRREAIRRAHAGEPHTRIARDLGISHSTVSIWVRDAPDPTPHLDWFLYRKEAV